MIVVDTGVLVALLDADDKHHQRCREWYADAEGPLIVPTPVMVETCYFIERDSDALTEANFLRSFDGGDTTTRGEGERSFILAQIDHDDLICMAELVEQYADSRSVRWTLRWSPSLSGWGSLWSPRSTIATFERSVLDIGTRSPSSRSTNRPNRGRSRPAYAACLALALTEC